MRILLTALAFMGIAIACQAQCEEKIFGKQLQKGMFLVCNDGSAAQKVYIAEVLSVNGSDFSCRFLHSNSVYQFRDFKKADKGSAATMQAVVKSSKGGAYKEGSGFIINVYMADPDVCDLSTSPLDKPYEVIATFLADNRRYLGKIIPTSNGYKLHFKHSSSTYTVDRNFKVTTVEDGGYSIGSKMTVVHARTLQF